MANLGKKGDIYHVRFRFGGREYKKSLKIRDKDAAQAARNLVELTIHRLLMAQLAIPPGIDPGDFIASSGTLLEPVDAGAAQLAPTPSTLALIEEYKESQKHLAGRVVSLQPGDALATSRAPRGAARGGALRRGHIPSPRRLSQGTPPQHRRT